MNGLFLLNWILEKHREGANWIKLAHGMVHWWCFMAATVTNLWV
jgi:hypothetical protein